MRASESRPRLVLVGLSSERERFEAELGEFYRLDWSETEIQTRSLLADPEVAAMFVAPTFEAGDGIALLDKLFPDHPEIRRVLIFEESDVDALVRAVNQGRVQYLLPKPTSPGELLGAIQRALFRGPHDAERVFRDHLTGLYSHRVFQERLREEVSRATRNRRPLTLILADIDRFKEWNERFGHPLGDALIRSVAEIVRLQARGSDVCARFGGEEFALLLPETHKEGGRAKAERLREAIRNMKVPELAQLAAESGLDITLSFGVAETPSDASTAQDLLSCADNALYVAKRRGRDNVQIYGEDPVTGDTWEVLPDGEISTLPGLALESPGANMPSLPDRQRELVSLLEGDGALGCLYIDLSRLRRIEQEYGSVAYSNVLAKASEALWEGDALRLRERDVVCRLGDDEDAFLVFLSQREAYLGLPRDGSRRSGRPSAELPSETLAALAHRLASWLDVALRSTVLDLLHHVPRTAVGFARAIRHPMIKGERQLSMLIDEARQSAEMQERLRRQRDKETLQEIILSDSLSTHYQPIVDFESRQIFGFEALTRGPRKSPLERPIGLFATAEEVDLLFELDRACFRGAIRRAAQLEPIHRLFVNVLPPSFYDHRFIGAEIEGLLAETHLAPANLVFEITERLAIENLQKFRQTLSHYTNAGFGVAIDDVGTKHSNLEAVIALRPNFLKLSDILTRGVARSPIKRELVKSLAKVASTIDAVIVAEGIETAGDLHCIRELGVRYGQGYFLARPAPPFPALRQAARRRLMSQARVSS